MPTGVNVSVSVNGSTSAIVTAQGAPSLSDRLQLPCIPWTDKQYR